MSWSANLVVALATGVLFSGCADPDPPAGPDPAAKPTGTPAVEAFDYCDLVDPPEATRAVEVLELDTLDGGPLRLVDRYATVLPEPAEVCVYGAAMQDAGPLRLTVHPDGPPVGHEPPEGAQPRPGLGSGAYAYSDPHSPRFLLGAPIGDVFLLLELPVRGGPRARSAEAERILGGLLDQAAGRLPAGATPAGLAAGPECNGIQNAAAAVRGGPPELSRYVEVDGSFGCAFAWSGDGVIVRTRLLRGEAEDYDRVVRTAVELTDVDDAWLLPTLSQVIAYAGRDVIYLQVRGADSRPDEFTALAGELAVEVVPVMRGG